MARWKLMQPHYLNVPGTEWEHRETNVVTGRQARKVYPVPLFLHPDDQADQNYPGEIIVANKPGGRDIVFVGPPTPDMEPLDSEAQAISDLERPKWKHPIESLSSNGYSDNLLQELTRQIAALGGIQAAPVSGIDQSAFATLQAQVAALMEQNAKLMAQLEEPLDVEVEEVK